MITPHALTELIRIKLPDADVQVQDRTGTSDHYNLHVRSRQFAGLSLLDQHRIIYGALDPALKDGRLHAVEIKTETPARP